MQPELGLAPSDAHSTNPPAADEPVDPPLKKLPELTSQRHRSLWLLLCWMQTVSMQVLTVYAVLVLFSRLLTWLSAIGLSYSWRTERYNYLRL
jgi:hypothetical protein